MAKEVVMPKLGLTMTEGTIENWLKAEGLQTAPQTVQRIQTAQTENFPMVPRMPKWQGQL